MIGIDFDNTIVSYDKVFHKIAVESGYFPISKIKIRDYLRKHSVEDKWTEMQGLVYGPRMKDAYPFKGVSKFFRRCFEKNIKISIISHRTIHPYIGKKYNLHDSARNWILESGLAGIGGLIPEQIHFKTTKEDKIGQISSEKCDIFIDDLPEVLSSPGFPENVKRILFDPNDLFRDETRFFRAQTWNEIEKMIFNTTN